jgi:50S ribosomal protein L16 3-hydroxylase
MDDELASYCHEEPPSALPQEATELTLKEGSLLFIPQGMWHETQASSDSLSLNFTYSVPSWVDLTLAALRSKLVMKEGWRQSLRYDCSDIEMANHFDDLLKEARNELSSWDSHELLQYFK